MTEAGWLASAHPRDTLAFLADRVGERKVRLFGVSCCRRVLHFLLEESDLCAIDLAERYAYGEELRKDVAAAGRAAAERARLLSRTLSRARLVLAGFPHDTPIPEGRARARTWARVHAIRAVAYVCGFPVPGTMASSVSDAIRSHTAGTRRGQVSPGRQSAAASAAEVEMEMATLLREIVGNPFSPVTVDPAWRAWNGGTVIQLAQAIYNEGRFADLPILADALEETGCTEASILQHCRGKRPHARECWCCDLLLGRS